MVIHAECVIDTATGRTCHVQRETHKNMTHMSIRQEAHSANIAIVDAGLVVLTWGNASVADRRRGVIAIKPSGVSYSDLSPKTMVIVSIETGEVVEGEHGPSSDTPTHLELYRAFPDIGAVVHTHSRYAVAFAQAKTPVQCQGTTHADNFRYDIPVTRSMTESEVSADYEAATGRVIAETFRKLQLDPREVPGVLVANHGPFAWGEDAKKAVENAIVLEEVSRMGLYTLTIRPDSGPAPRHLIDKHYLRKHGPGAYYGQTRQSGAPDAASPCPLDVNSVR